MESPPPITLAHLASARSGDKGNHANIVVVAHSRASYEWLETHLTASRVAEFFSELHPRRVVRYALPNVVALNFLLYDVLDGGGSMSLRSDSQGKLLGTAILEMPCADVPSELAS